MAENSPPYSETTIANILKCKATDLEKLVSSESFLDPWEAFRDYMVSEPAIATKLPRYFLEAVIGMLNRVLAAIIDPATSPYDRPKNDDRKHWAQYQHYECFAYQVCKNLSRKGEHLEGVFDSATAPSSPDFKDYGRPSMSVRGVSYLLDVLIHYYKKPTSGEVPKWIMKIEALRPFPDPARSPIPSVRRQHELKQMTSEELFKTVSEKLRDTYREKLIAEILADEGYTSEQANKKRKL